MINCRRVILEYAEATIYVIDMGHGVIIQAMDKWGARLVQDTTRIKKISQHVKDMCSISGFDHFTQLVRYLRETGYTVKSTQEMIQE